MSELFKGFLSLSLSGSLVIAALLLCRPLYRERVSRRWQYYIWLVAVARLLLPLAPEASLMNALFRQAEEPQASYSGIPGEYAPVLPSPAAAEEDHKSPVPARVDPAALVRAAAERAWVVWLAVAALLAIRKITLYQSFVKYIRAGREEVADVARLDALARAGEEAGVKRPVELYVNRLISSPLLLGFFRPCIVLPGGDLPEEDFRYTVRHELIHCRRRDMLYKWLVQATACLHWFNPLVWRMEREISRACELSCDEAALEGLDSRERRAYGDTLLRAMEGGTYQDSLASLPLRERGKLLKERLKAIMEYRTRSRWMTALSAVLAAVVLMGAAAAGAYTGSAPSRAEPQRVKTEGKGEPSMSLRYTQEGYCQPPYLFELGWNISEKDGRYYTDKEITLSDGTAMTVYCTDECGADLKDRETVRALAELLSRLRQETRDTAFPMTMPLVVSVQKVGDTDPAELAAQYYQEGALPQFGAVFAQLTEDQQRPLLTELCEDGSSAFLSTAINKLEEDSPLIVQYAEKTYDEGDIAAFSILAGRMSREALEDWTDRAETDGRTAFRSVLYSMTDQVRELEDMKAALDRAQAEEYAAHGLVKRSGAYYYKDQPVRIFMDQRQDDQSFRTLDVNPRGAVDVEVVRDRDDQILSVGLMSQEAAAELLEDWDDDDDWGDWEDWDEPEPLSADEENALPVEIDSVKGGEIVWLGEYQLSCGDRVSYDLSAAAGRGLEVGFAKPGDTSLNIRYFSVSNRRQGSEDLRCASSFTMEESSPVEPGRYALYVRATDGPLTDVTGKVAVTSGGEGVVSLTVEDLPEAVREAMRGCGIREWYVIPYDGRQYISCNGFAWSFGYQPALTEEGWRVNVVRFQKKDQGRLLLSAPGEEGLELCLDGEPVAYTVLTCGQ